MAKSSKKIDELFKDKDPEQIVAGLKAMVTLGDSMSRTASKLLKQFEGETPENEVAIIDAAAIPAAYFMRDSVLEAVRLELIKDIKNNQPVPPGVEVLNGETEKVSDPESDKSKQGPGSKSQKNSSDNGPPDSGSGESDNRQPDAEHNSDPEKAS